MASPRAVLLRVIAAGGVVAGGMALQARSHGPPVADVGLAEPDGAITDHGYQFRLAVPGPGWQVMGPAEARRMNPDASAYATHAESSLNAYMIVEPSGGEELDIWMKSILENHGMEKFVPGPIERTTLAGREARRAEYSGEFEGMAVRVVILLVKHQGYLYHLKTWHTQVRTAEHDRQLALLEASLTLLDGPVQPESDSMEIGDAAGVGWRFERGIFEDAFLGIRAAPTPGLRVIVGNELVEMSEEAAVGFLARSGAVEVQAVVTGELAPTPSDDFLAGLKVAFGEELIPGEPPDRGERMVLGHPARFARWRTTEGLSVEFLYAAVMHRGLAVQLQIWYLASVAASVEPLIDQILGSISVLPEEERLALGRELAAKRDPEAAVGPGFKLRAGRFRDFAGGFEWRKPAGFWRVTTGRRARLVEERAALAFEVPVSGHHGYIRVESLDAFGDLASAHRAELAEWGGRASRPVARRVGGWSTLVSTAVDDDKALSVATVGGPTGRIHLAVWSLPELAEREREVLDAALAGLKFTSEVEVEVVDGEVIHHRFGYAFRPGIEVAEVAPSNLRGIGSVYGGESSGGFVGVTAMSSYGDDSFDADAYILGMEAKLAPGPRRELPGKLGGVSARRIAIGRAGDLLVVTRDRVTYALIVGGERRDEVIESFRFLDP